MTDSKFADLEKRVKVLKTKKYIKIISVVFVFFCIGYYAFMQNKTDKIEKTLHVKSVKKVPSVKKYKPIKEVEKTIKIDKIIYDTIKLAPKINFLYEEKQQTKIKNIIKIKNIKPIKRSKSYLHVKDNKSEEALLESFKDARDFKSAMGLANLYFLDSKFEKSIYWSKKASELSSGEESAWIIYAKSKYALNEIEDAIKVLQLYLEYFSSDEIEKLLKLYRSEK